MSTRWTLGVVAATVVAAHIARADDQPSYHASIDQVSLEPSVLGGQRLRVLVSIMSLQGQVVDMPEASAIRLVVNGSKLDAPFALGTYGQTSSDTAIVLVLQASLDYSDVLPVIGDAIDQYVLAPANDRTQVAVVQFGDSIGAGKLGSVKAARGKVTTLSSDGSVAEPLLLDTIERALVVLKKAKTKPEGRPLRKLMVVVSDGRDSSGDKDRVTRLGIRAAKDGVRIDTFAYSPKDVRRPLLLLGELSKRSYGTFRWIRGAKADSWGPVFQQLGGELARQLVLTYFVPADEDLANKKVKVVITGRAEVTTNEHKIPESLCAGQTCEPGAYCAEDRCNLPRTAHHRGVLGWLLVIAGIVIAVIVALGVIGYFLTKRQQQPAVPGGAPVPAPPQPKPPISRPASMPPPQPVAVPPAAPAPLTGPRFYVMSGPRTGEEIAVRHGFLIGKQPGCDLQIDDGYTSSQHAQIGMDHFGNCRLYDRGSTNGTFVNGVRVTEYPLEHGNTVRIGSTDLRFLAQ